tara:strand:+ start:1626 stop:2315 length:690 start_codon:yes stop_codon:yes gene_type:complete
VIAGLFSKTAANIFFGAALLASLIPLYAIWKWGRFQYGNGWLWTPREAIYLNASDETKETLEKFFAYIRRENGPKIYYRDRKGKEHKLDRHFSFGKLRVLLLSEFGAFRSLCLLPGGKRISEAIKIDADPDEIINALKTKPKRKGGPGTRAKYPYEDAIVGLIGDPRLAQLDLEDPDAAIRSLSGWIVEWFTANADASGDGPRADYGRVQACARKIYDRLKSLSSPKAH